MQLRVGFSVMCLLMAAATLAACSETDGNQGSANRVSSGEGAGTFNENDCWWDRGEVSSEVTITCGTVEVPLDWSDPDGAGQVTLRVARLHHQDADADAEPVLMLHGGPGGASLVTAPVQVSYEDMVEARDVVLWDQRGSGGSTPSLDCPEREASVVEALGDDLPFADELAQSLPAAEACHDRLTEEGIDLSQFNTLASVNDIEALRRAFDTDRWNLFGSSYGTRLGLAYAREHPDRVRSMVLDSVYPLEAGGLDRITALPQEAFDRLFEACESDPACSSAYPDLADLFDQAVEALNSAPAEVTTLVDIGGESETVSLRITGADFRSGIFVALYQDDLIPILPSVIDAVANGDLSSLPAYLDTAVPVLIGISEGALYSIDCADSSPLLDGATASDIGGDGSDSIYSLVLSQTYCQVWDVAALPESHREPALPDVPTLVFGGTLDPVTPHTDSQAQATAMPDARFVSVPRGGHGVSSFDECTRSTVTSFLDDPGAELPPCADAIVPTPFSVPAES